MKKNYLLSASLVCGNMLRFGEEIKELTMGKIDYLHFDVMDGVFVPRYGMFPEMLSQLRKLTNVPVDVHLMVANAEPYLKTFADSGASILVIHAESTAHLHRQIKLVKNLGLKAGVALNPATSFNVLDYILDDLDLVMLMAINPGIVGHKLIPSALEKIKELRKKLKNYPNIIIEIDGGVTPETAPIMIKAGADMLVCGTGTIYKPPIALDKKIKEVRKIIDKQLS